MIVASCLIVAGLANANYVAELSLDEKVSASDLVVIGTVIPMPDSNETSRSVDEYATVQVETVLKGEASGSILFLSKGSISELNPDCCRAGARYFFLLKRINENKFASVNGRYGVYLISDKEAESN
jgi:hypothetical protein